MTSHYQLGRGSIENERLRLESWRALETLYEEGKCKAIGVSNFTIPHLENLLANCKVKPMVNQVEFHPKLFQKDLVGFCEKNGIVVEAYSPFAKGALLTNAVVKKVAQLHGKSAAQIICKWCLQHNTVVLPKCSTTARLQENFSVFDFELTTEDMQTLDGLNDNWHCTWDPTNIR
jgi:diketogulonate reductase-like aldo/keto reductase